MEYIFISLLFVVMLHEFRKIIIFCQFNRPSVWNLFSYFHVQVILNICFCFLGTEVPDLLQYPVTRQKQKSDAIEDVFDRRLYKKHFGEDGFFRGSLQMRKRQIHLSLQVNTDGVAVFRSSKFSIWPVYFIVNELPPNCRYIYIHLNLYTYTHLLTAYSACDTHANVLMGM